MTIKELDVELTFVLQAVRATADSTAISAQRINDLSGEVALKPGAPVQSMFEGVRSNLREAAEWLDGAASLLRLMRSDA